MKLFSGLLNERARMPIPQEIFGNLLAVLLVNSTSSTKLRDLKFYMGII